jgi:hypothetical protein
MVMVLRYRISAFSDIFALSDSRHEEVEPPLAPIALIQCTHRAQHEIDTLGI